MIPPSDFLDELLKRGVGIFTGIPCSILSPLIDSIPNFIVATSEAEAMGIALGGSLTGKVGAVLFQNSGLGDMVDIITSFAHPYKIPCLMVISQRGYVGDADHHRQMGSITSGLLDLLEIFSLYLPDDANSIPSILDGIFEYMNESQRPAALIIGRGVF